MGDARDVVTINVWKRWSSIISLRPRRILVSRVRDTPAAGKKSERSWINRPAVVISSAAYHRARPDLMIMAITSQQPSTLSVGEVQIQDWRGAGLLKPSVLKPILTTIDPALVRKRLGQLAPTDQAALRQALNIILG
ncbi:MAG: type II toxin-antitoxin system PemK/MazF family toxin [Nitrospira sp. CG24E]|nr:MAG: type II toxin-antitoxin system PemK/MazF family toxin [Nitrospira sp. CG24E]